ncbi:MAG: SoxR reducing system RseC family protein [bacterium]
MKEKGIVVEIHGFVAKIRLMPSEACKGCPSSGICRPAGKTMLMEADNKVKAAIGDEVWVETLAKQSMIAVFFLFVFPILLGLIVILITTRYGVSYMVIGGIIGLAIGLLLAKIIDSHLRKIGKLLPTIIEVIKSENA